jgi:hypothetical protein
MREIDQNILDTFSETKIKPYLCLDMDLAGDHYRITTCDVPIKNFGHDVTGDQYFAGGDLGTNLGAMWRLDELDGTTAHDSVGTNDLTLYKSPQWKRGKRQFHSSLRFNGSNYLYATNTTSGGELNPANNLSVCVIAKPSNFSFGSQQYLVRRQNTYRLFITNTGAISFTVYNGTNWFTASIPEVAVNGKTHVIVGTCDGSYVRLYAYVNGELYTATATEFLGAMNQSSQHFYIASDTGTGYFIGDISQVRIYNERTLSAAEVNNFIVKTSGAWTYTAGSRVCDYVNSHAYPEFDAVYWTPGDDWVIDGNGKAIYSGTIASSIKTGVGYVTIGDYYRYEVEVSDIDNDTTASLRIGYSGTVALADGSNIGVVQAGSSTAISIIASGGGITVDSIKIVPCAAFIGTLSSSTIANLGAVQNGCLYKVDWSITGFVTGTFKVTLGSSGGSLRTANGDYTEYIYAEGDTITDISIIGGSTPEAVITKCKVSPVLWVSKDINTTELVKDRMFVIGQDADSPWYWGTGWTSPDLSAEFSSGTGDLIQAGIFTDGLLYKFVVKVTSIASGATLKVYCGQTAIESSYYEITESGTYEFYLACRGNTNLVLRGSGGAISVKKVSAKKFNITDLVEVYSPNMFEFGSISLSTSQIVDNVDITILDVANTYKGIFIEQEYIQGSRFTLFMVLLDDSRVPIGEDLNYRIVLFDGTLDSWDLDEELIKVKITNQLYQWERRTLRKHSATCGWRTFGSSPCPHILQSGESCDREYNQCSQWGHTAYFGGFRFLPSLVDKDIWWGSVPSQRG